MSNLTVKDTSKLTVHTKGTSLGAADNLTSSDVQVPSLILFQKMTDMDGDYKEGDMIHSISGDVLGSAKSPLELIVADCYLTQVWYEGKNWIKTMDWDAAMEADPYESIVDGIKIKKQKCFNYVCFQALDVREIEIPGEAVQYLSSPLIVKFKGASGKFGKKFNSTLMDYAAFGKPSWVVSFNLTTHSEENEHGKFMVLEMAKGKPAIPAQQLAAENLLKTFRTARVKGEIDVVDSDEKVVSNDVPNHAPGVGSF